MRPLRICLFVALAFAIAGCGSSTKRSASLPDGAGFAPATSVVYVSVVSDPASSQWEKADQLLGKFPGRVKLLASAIKDLRQSGLSWEEDVKPALGPTVDVALLSYEDPHQNAVFFTKPADPAKFNELLETEPDPQVHREIDGWTVFADNEQSLDNFAAAQAKGDSLADDENFDDAMSGLPEDAGLRAYVAGEPLYAYLEKESANVQPFRSLSPLGELKALSFAATAEDDGVSAQAVFEQDKSTDIGSYSAELDDAVPTGALLYASFGNLQDFLDKTLEQVQEKNPSLQQQYKQFEKALNLDLHDDVFALFSKEGAIAVYRGADAPSLLFALRVPDEEDKAQGLIDRLAALVRLGDGSVLPFNAGGVEGTAFVLSDEGVTIYAIVDDGKAFVSNDKRTIEAALGDSEKLSDDSAYQDAQGAASVPDKTNAFVYANLAEGLPFLFNSDLGAATPEERANTKPLESVLLYTDQDGNRTTLSGFLTIK
jgi:hypothetical protein